MVSWNVNPKHKNAAEQNMQKQYQSQNKQVCYGSRLDYIDNAGFAKILQ
jgi:hypothetical protein